MLRIMLVDDTQREISLLAEALVEAGYSVVARVDSPMELLRRVADINPDVIMIDTDSPSRDVLEQVCVITQEAPRPIVMFTDDSGSDTIRNAIRAGVTAYVVRGMTKERLAPVMEVAIQRFEAEQELKLELADAQSQLSDRKIIERAKGILMKQRKISEEEAYRMLRKLAMDRNRRLIEVAQQVLDMAELLG